MSITWIFIDFAERFINLHSYFVSAGSDVQEVCKKAETECQERAGKYGIEVIEFPGEVRIAYFQSIDKEKFPRRNMKTYAYERIGKTIADAVKEGKTLIPDEKGICHYTFVEIPLWIKKEVERQEEIAKILIDFVEGKEVE